MKNGPIVTGGGTRVRTPW